MEKLKIKQELPKLKILQIHFDNVRNGIKDLEIRKKDYGFKDWTKVELVVIEHNCYISDEQVQCDYHWNGDLQDECIKERLIVELKQTPMTAFEIGLEINNQATLHYWYAGNGSGECDDECYEKHEENYDYYHEQIAFMYDEIKHFVKDYHKQGEPLFLYDLRLVE